MPGVAAWSLVTWNLQRAGGAERIAAAVEELEYVEGRWSALAFQEGGRVGDGAADEVEPEAVPYPGPHHFVARDPRVQVGIVLHRRLGGGLRGVEVHPRFALAWLDVRPQNIVLGSVHAPDCWSSDVDAFCSFLDTLSEALRRLVEKAPQGVEVALGGDWNASAADVSLTACPRSAALQSFMRRWDLALRASGSATWHRAGDAAHAGR